MICYVDDLLQNVFKPKKYTDALNMMYFLKEGCGPLDRYVGANVDELQLKYGRVIWSTNRVDYLKSAIDNVDNSLAVDNREIKNYGDEHR